MKRFGKVGRKVILFVVGLFVLLGAFLFSPTWTYADPSYEDGVYELRQVMIQNVLHQVMMRGSSKDNPVVLFVQDGFDSLIPMARKHEEVLEQIATLVHYDLRGTAMTPRGDVAKDYFSLLVEDVVQLTTYLRREFKAEKIILVGHGTGSMVAIQAAHKYPEYYQAYIGISQIGDMFAKEEAVLSLMEDTADEKTKAILAKTRAEVSQRQGFVDEALIQKPASLQWNEDLDRLQAMLFMSERNGYQAIQAWRRNDRSLEEFQQSLVTQHPSMIESLEVPFYGVSGRYDYLVPLEVSKSVYDQVTSNDKQWVEFTSSAHYPMFEEPGRFATLLRDVIRDTNVVVDAEKEIENEDE